MHAERRITVLSVWINVVLTLLKLAAGIFGRSQALVADAVHSLSDFATDFAVLVGLRLSSKPRDEDHSYGHGKFETLATIIQSVVIGASGLWVMVESVRRLLAGVELGNLQGGIAVLAGSAVVSWKVSRFLVKTARETDSSALQADSLHFSMDVYTNLALLVGLVLITWFGIAWLDPVLSIVVALYIFYQAFGLVRYGLRDILDERLPDTLREEITQVLEAHRKDLLGYHRLRTRRAGSQKIIDFHLTLCKFLSVEEAHAIADHLELRIKQRIPGADVTIHVEPCVLDQCPGYESCPGRQDSPKGRASFLAASGQDRLQSGD